MEEIKGYFNKILEINLTDRMVKETIIGDEKRRVVPLKEMLEKYYKLRGYNSDGTPDQKLLERLQIAS